MVVGVGHVNGALVKGCAQTMLQAGFGKLSVDIAKLEEPFANESLHPAGGAEIRRAQRAGLAVGEIKPAPVRGDAAWLSQGGVLERTIRQALPGTARVNPGLKR